MLGWQIYINRHQIDRGACESGLRDETLIATWETSINGRHWLESLVKEGKAKELPGDYCIRRYSVKAKNLLPVIGTLHKNNERPIVVGEGEDQFSVFNRNIKIYQSRIDECPPDELLFIETWDLS